METNFNFKSQICTTREQSERLIALGLKKETADMVLTEYSDGVWRPSLIFDDGDDGYDTSIYPKFEPVDIPAWSLHRLIELIWGEGKHEMSLETHRPFEDCIERIDYMINQSCCFNKEYLEE